MGTCQSTGVATATVQPSAGVNAKQPKTNDIVPRPKCRVNSINESSVNSSTTGMTAAVSDLRSGEESIPEEHALVCPDHHRRSVPDVIATLPKAAMNNVDRIANYLKSSGATGSRIMVHIEKPEGMPIEAVYDGVHDGRILGEGITGAVRLITHKKTGIQLAVKRLDLDQVADDGHLDRLLDEIKIMCALDHPNIVCLEEVYEGDSELYLTQELCKGGDLFDRLDEQPDYHYSEAECARLIKQISSAVTYLHSKGVIHRDLKLENFLFQDERSDSELKMIDFGLSKHFNQGELQTEKVGTPYTVAPECIRGEGYDEKCDVWSIGVICYLLLCGETPFGGDSADDDLYQVRQNITSGNVPFDPDLWGNVSEEAIDFIKTLLVLDPERRPSALEAQNHPWIHSLWKKSHDCQDTTLNPKVVTGLVSFKSLSTTKRFLCEVLSFTLQPDQITGLHEEFEKMDVDGTGEISLSKFKDALLAQSDDHCLGEDEIDEMFSGLKLRDTDASIQWHEFLATCLSQCHIDDRNIRLAFERLDTERKGFITWQDLQRSMDMYGSADSKNDLQHIWVNHIIDYRINKEHMTYDDFYSLLKLDKCSRQSIRTDGSNDCEPEQKTTVPYKGILRHSMAGPAIDPKEIFRTEDESTAVDSVLACQNIRGFLAEASKGVESGKKNSTKGGPPRRATVVTGNRGLLMSRTTPIVHCNSD